MKAVASLGPSRPKLGLVLGSGFAGVAQAIATEAQLSFADVPGFAVAGVPGHAGRVILGRLAGVPVWVLAGRAHFYEGHSLTHVTFPVRVLAALGVTDLVLTNAAGGIHRRFRPGDFMVIADHLNFMGANPLRGWPGASPFVDLSQAYDPLLSDLLRRAAKATKCTARPGVYAAVSGPSFETPAEIRAFARLGADAVGMSTVPEVIAARHCGLRVAGLSCITNLAAGRSEKPVSHAEVLEIGRSAAVRAAALLQEFARLYAASENHSRVQR